MAFAIGVALARGFATSPAWALALLLAATGSLVLLGRGRPRLALGLSLVIALAAGCGLSGAALIRQESVEARVGALSGKIRLTVRVVGGVDRDERRSRAWVEISETPDDLRDLLGVRLSLGVYDNPDLSFLPGDLLRGDLWLDGIGKPENPLLPDYGEYLRAHRIAGWARDTGELELLGTRHDAETLFLRLREWLNRRVMNGIQPEARGLARAILTGDRGELTPTDLERFKIAGVFHLLAVSGLHVGIVGYLAFLLGGALPLKRRGRYVLSLVVIVGFTLLTGARPPALRACLMAGLYLGGRFAGRPAKLGTSVAGAGLFLLALNPLTLWNLSFQLSFVAAAGIAAITPSLSGWLTERKVPRPIADGLGASLAAQLAIFSLLALHFARVPVLAFLLNIVAIPLVGIALALGIPYLILAAAVPVVAKFLGTPLSLVLRLVNRLAGEASRIPLITADLRQPAVWLVILTLGLLVVAWWLWRRGRVRWRPLIPLGVIFALWGWHLLRSDLPDRLRITFFSVARGDAIFIESPAGDRIVIDGGMDTAEPVAEYLRRRGIIEIDTICLSHPNADHCSGLTPLFHRCGVGRVYRPPDYLVTEAYLRYLLTERLSGAEVRLPGFGEPIPTRDGKLEITVLSNSDRPYPGGESNDASLVLLLRYGDFEALFTGDLEGAGERALLDRWEPTEIDVLKVAHHGSATSTTPDILTALRPGHGVVFPDRGLLADEVRWRLADSGCWLYDVGSRGACVLETDGRTFRLGRFDGSFSPAVALAGD